MGEKAERCSIAVRMGIYDPSYHMALIGAEEAPKDGTSPAAKNAQGTQLLGHLHS